MPTNLLYLDPWSGLSGDMMLAALLDAGGEPLEGTLRSAVASLGLEGVAVEIERRTEWGIACTLVRVQDEQSPPLRHRKEMLDVIAGARVSDGVKARAAAAVERLAAVEADIHGCPVDDIHFHEVGAADTLVDIVGTFALVEALSVGQVFVGTIPLGGGTVEIAHGRMGVPAPATAALLSGYEVVGGPEMRELTTPTGALLARELNARQGMLPAMKVTKIGYGAGTMRLQAGPNVLRVVLGEEPEGQPVTAGSPAGASESVVELQTNLDDASGEVIGYTLRRLRDAGVLDAWTVPIHMKKDRPGVVLHVLVKPGEEAQALGILFAETGTLGVRRSLLSRYIAERGSVEVDVGGCRVAVKWGRWGDGHMSLAPEYEDVAAAAGSLQIPLLEVMRRANDAAEPVVRKGAGS